MIPHCYEKASVDVLFPFSNFDDGKHRPMNDLKIIF